MIFSVSAGLTGAVGLESRATRRIRSDGRLARGVLRETCQAKNSRHAPLIPQVHPIGDSRPRTRRARSSKTTPDDAEPTVPSWPEHLGAEQDRKPSHPIGAARRWLGLDCLRLGRTRCLVCRTAAVSGRGRAPRAPDRWSAMLDGCLHKAASFDDVVRPQQD